MVMIQDALIIIYIRFKPNVVKASSLLFDVYHKINLSAIRLKSSVQKPFTWTDTVFNKNKPSFNQFFCVSHFALNKPCLSWFMHVYMCLKYLSWIRFMHLTLNLTLITHILSRQTQLQEQTHTHTHELRDNKIKKI